MGSLALGEKDLDVRMEWIRKMPGGA